MKKVLLSILSLVAVQISAQQDFFALTGFDTSGIKFKDFRLIDGDRGTSRDVIFNNSSTVDLFSQSKKAKASEQKNGYHNSQAISMATLALDKTNNLVYMPLYSTNIYVLDVATKQLTLVENELARVSPCDVGSQFTRMATGIDGAVYALNNAGTQFVKISNISGEYKVENLGVVKNAASNGENSFNQIKTGFGGDMVADIDNNFYVFASSGIVFKITTSALTANFVGKIDGLPEGYTVNGAAVDKAGNVVVATSTGGELYSVDLSTLKASPIAGSERMFVYDLASKYVIDQSTKENVLAGLEVYPARTTDGQVTVAVKNTQIKGVVRVDVFDLSGKAVTSKTANVKSGTFKETLSLNKLPNGVYLINVVNESGKVLGSKKIIIAQ